MRPDRKIAAEMRAIEDETRWQAVEARDAQFDGVFFYGVRSTQIYCKPSCAARRPRREQVEFFTSPGDAESSGFRACLRCHPRRAPGPGPQVEIVLRACRAIEAHIEEAVSLKSLSAELGINQTRLHRIFKTVTGVTPRQYAASVRLGQFKSGIKKGRGVTDAMYEAGYGSSSRLYERAGENLGMTPATYARGGAGAMIRFTIVACHLGRMLVAATGRGICAVSFGDDDDELVNSLASEYPAAEIRPDDRALSVWVGQLLKHLRGAHPALDLPVDVQATAFQLRVWEELRKIPYGSTRTYAEIAESIGRPTATRAVARACATNPVALVTPCHRVIRTDGGASGYRWGVKRKKSLLAEERKRAGRTLKETPCLPFDSCE
ncbi:MAG TPA: bifunctional DNA-binding transcriptional regulator/O6-methylguanine-DNA methyltransferase Ada [Blastocatellia bacterium]|nr:bifunctional DNA-binding transcriptional regulator/O6-methylguanine-DNA methyltransferase Ada [Blastocatellia bacterium]